jgi:hypothetical protein
MRTVGGDALPGGQYSGVFVFLTNGWQIVVNHLVTIDGILYSDTSGQSPYVINSGGGIINKVASLAYAYDTSGVSADEIASAVWNKPATYTDKTTMGGYINKLLLTIPKFLGLK